MTTSPNLIEDRILIASVNYDRMLELIAKEVITTTLAMITFNDYLAILMCLDV